jgi:hypothetical protein
VILTRHADDLSLVDQELDFSMVSGMWKYDTVIPSVLNVLATIFFLLCKRRSRETLLGLANSRSTPFLVF